MEVVWLRLLLCAECWRRYGSSDREPADTVHSTKSKQFAAAVVGLCGPRVDNRFQAVLFERHLVTGWVLSMRKRDNPIVINIHSGRLTGVLIYTIHSTNKKPIKLFGTNVEQFKVFAMDIKLGKYPNMSCISPGIVDYVRLMIHYDPEQRPSLYELPKVRTFGCL